jgi:hypothetical protein
VCVRAQIQKSHCEKRLKTAEKRAKTLQKCAKTIQNRSKTLQKSPVLNPEIDLCAHRHARFATKTTFTIQYRRSRNEEERISMTIPHTTLSAHRVPARDSVPNSITN